jgi:Protein of unknown function (DUF1353)
MTDKMSFLRTILLHKPKDMIGPPAPIVPFADWDYYYVDGAVSWKPPVGSDVPFNVDVPIGFVTDLASIPRVFWAILPPAARYSYPAIVHDFLYWTQPCTRQRADEVLKLAMKDMDVPVLKAHPIYDAVRLAGGAAWSSNAAAKKSGEKRVLKRFPPDPKISWTQWKSEADVFAD